MNPLHPSFMLLAFAIILLGGWAIGNGRWIGILLASVGAAWFVAVIIKAITSSK